MSVQPMKFVSMIGPVEKCDEFVLKYVLGSDIQLEHAWQVMEIKGLSPFYTENPYEVPLKRMNVLNETMKAGIRTYSRSEMDAEVFSPFDMNAMPAYLEAIDDRLTTHKATVESLNRQVQEHEQILLQIQPLTKLDVDIDEMFHVSFFKFRFGKISRDSWNRQKTNLEKLDVIVLPVSESETDVWLSYFTPAPFGFKIDSVFAAIGFERVRISEMVSGTPSSIMQKFQDEIVRLRSELEEENTLLGRFIENEKSRFEAIYNRVLYLNKVVEIKRSCSHTRDTFFVVGWMPEESFSRLKAEVDTVIGVLISSENPEEIHKVKPPTILRNRRFFKPFESLVTMYGLPSYNELDPTKFVAFTYIFMFGFMFGDIGQGLLIAVAGFLLYTIRKLPLGGVMMYVGLSSTVFGFLYGSIFGNEHVYHALWLSPIESSDNINLLLLISIGYGAFIILASMGINMINAIRVKDWGRLLFDRNGLAGMLFYGGILAVVTASILAGRLVVTGILLAVIILLPLILMFFKEPLEHWIEHRKLQLPEEKGMFFVGAFFEMYETLLGFMSNTISFVRVSALALNHAGLSLAIWTIYHMVDGVGGIVALILGNALIIGLEGMIVGIQCLRLEYYEMFGRFFKGDGTAFKPLQIKQ